MTIPDVCLLLLTGVAVNLAVAARRYLVTLTRVEDVWLLRRQTENREEPERPTGGGGTC